MKEKQDARLWLRESGLDGALNEHHRLGCVYPGILTLLTLGSLSLVRYGWWIPILPAVLGILSHRFARPYLHRKMVCPQCGYNPTLRKSDGQPRQDYHKVLAQLERYEDCPNCGKKKNDEEAPMGTSSGQDLDDLGEVGEDQVG